MWDVLRIDYNNNRFLTATFDLEQDARDYVLEKEKYNTHHNCYVVEKRVEPDPIYSNPPFKLSEKEMEEWIKNLNNT